MFPRLQLRKDVAAMTGAQLRVVVEEILKDLTDTSNTQALTDRLRGALANTAARGETCHLTPAVTAVRLARRHLEAGDRAEARQALSHALTCLPTPVVRRVRVHRVVERTSMFHAVE
jgi:hypothetical protein